MWFVVPLIITLIFSIFALFLIGVWISTADEKTKYLLFTFSLTSIGLTLYFGRYYPVVKILSFLYIFAFLVGYTISSIDKIF